MKPIQLTIHPLVATASLVVTTALVLGSWKQTQSRNYQYEQYPFLTPEQHEILNHMSIVQLDDGHGGQAKTIRFTGVNVQVVNGLGATNGNPLAPDDYTAGLVNGLGNVIVGYNELGHSQGDNRTGSHNVIVGDHHNASSFGGLVVGRYNQILAPCASISGGTSGKASGLASSIGGGNAGTASGQNATIAGGQVNTATALRSVIVGGAFNRVDSQEGVCVGGSSNLVGNPLPGAFANQSVVVGGYDNQARGQGSTVVGGRFNNTTANYSGILAGTSNTCVGDPQGGGSYCAIVGGGSNSTSAVTAATIGGGQGRSATGSYDWVAGSLFQDQ